MWVAKLKLKHDCIIGNRCKEFNIMMQSLDLNEEKKNGKFLTSSIHQLIGNEKDVDSCKGGQFSVNELERRSFESMLRETGFSVNYAWTR